jgi:tryptophan halogenase
MQSEPAADGRIRHIAIVGGDLPGWMAASMLARALSGSGCRITVIESPGASTPGAVESSLPPIIDLLRFLGINEPDFVRHTRATFSLGTRFHDWHRLGESFWHPFGSIGLGINRRPFFHAWHRARAVGIPLRFEDASLGAALAEAGRFRFPDPAARNPSAGLRYGLHFDAGLAARYLRAYSQKLAVECLERAVAEATQCADGRLDELVFADGSRLRAELFLDCSGPRGVLIEQTLRTGYIDWSEHLPCDRALLLPTELAAPRAPCTQASAHGAGWRWRIPLQHRAGNGYVYASAHLHDGKALEALLRDVGGKALAEPQQRQIVAGRRRLFWHRNCVAVGAAAGCLEPLESTSVHLVANALYQLLDHFPDLAFAAANIDAYNRALITERESLRDFLVGHYCLSAREDTPFWQHCRVMKLPDSLAQRIELYRCTGRIRSEGPELFADASWFCLFEGMGLRPASYDPLLDGVGAEQLRELLVTLAQSIGSLVAAAPSHDSYFPPAAPAGAEAATGPAGS